MKNILQLENDGLILRRHSRELTKEEIRSEEIQSLIFEMKDIMRDAPGVGLAAPQIGFSIQLAVIEDPEEIVTTAKRIQQLGYTQVEAFSPFPIKNLDEYVTRPFNPVAGYCLAGGIIGGLSGFFMQYYA